MEQEAAAAAIDPQIVTLIVAGMGMAGTLLAGFGGAYLNHKWTAERDKEDRKIELNIKNIKTAYSLLTKLETLCELKTVSEMEEKGTNAALVFDNIETTIADLKSIVDLYIPSVSIKLIEIECHIDEMRRGYRRDADFTKDARQHGVKLSAAVYDYPFSITLLYDIRKKMVELKAEVRRIAIQQDL